MSVLRNPSGKIPELTADPASPIAENAWVLATIGGATGGGKINAFLGAGFPYLKPGSGGASTYQFSYRTKESTTKRVTIT